VKNMAKRIPLTMMLFGLKLAQNYTSKLDGVVTAGESALGTGLDDAFKISLAADVVGALAPEIGRRKRNLLGKYGLR